MDHEAIAKILSDILMADSESYWIIGGLPLVIVAVMRAMLPVKSLALVFAPAIFWGGLAGIYVMRELGFVAAHEKNANVVFTAALGMIVAMIVMLLATRLVDMATRIRRPLTNSPGPARL
jgi:hypothetical protein